MVQYWFKNVSDSLTASFEMSLILQTSAHHHQLIIVRKFHTLFPAYGFLQTTGSQWCTVWKLRNFTATIFLQIFRQINVLLTDFTVNQFDEKKFAWQ